jgi:hypothetical protein
MLRKGDLIKLRGYKGKSIVRRFLGTRNETVLICSNDEFQAARREKRDPVAVGFQLRDVIGVQAESLGFGNSGEARSSRLKKDAIRPQPNHRFSQVDRISGR